MSLLTDLLIADDGDAPSIAVADAPLGRWPGVDLKGRSEVTLGSLWCILRGEPLRTDEYGAFRLLCRQSDAGPWVVAVPPELTARLAGLDPLGLKVVAARWSFTEGMQSAGRDRVERLLRECRRLAQEALAAGKPLVMWVRL